jgi:uncharacterized LabA/DUF88 family protein
MRTNIYIDGFNLYYRLVRDAPALKWLNLEALCAAVLQPQNQIQRIRYYTARISGRSDPTSPARQQVYLDALETLPCVSIHLGSFLVSRPWVGLVHPPKMKGGSVPEFTQPYPKVVRVWKTEEKGSDVNLASHLLRDAFRGDFDVAAVLSNDTDLVEPIRIVVQDIGLPVGLICPVPRPAASLQQLASFVRHIRPTHLHASQFPDVIPGTSLSRPTAWV